MGRAIALVAAPRRRRGGICQAREQFDVSSVFRRARDLCERTYSEWYILSTAHGLMAPRQVIGADEPSLHELPASARAAWASRVACQLRERTQRSAERVTFVLYASQWHAEVLRRAAPCADFEQPLAGMSLGERVRWYNARLEVRPRVLTRARAGD